MPRRAGDHLPALQQWFDARIPPHWFEAPPEVIFDNEEILVVGTLPSGGADATPGGSAARIERFREETREERMGIAALAEERFRRKVSWGARCGDVTEYFSTASVPVMTRLRMQERSVLDTLVDAGVARSRSEALAWCVRLVGRNESEWIDALRQAFEHVESVRAQGPRSERKRRPGGG